MSKQIPTGPGATPDQITKLLHIAAVALERQTLKDEASKAKGAYHAVLARLDEKHGLRVHPGRDMTWDRDAAEESADQYRAYQVARERVRNSERKLERACRALTIEGVK